MLYITAFSPSELFPWNPALPNLSSLLGTGHFLMGWSWNVLSNILVPNKGKCRVKMLRNFWTVILFSLECAIFSDLLHSVIKINLGSLSRRWIPNPKKLTLLSTDSSTWFPLLKDMKETLHSIPSAYRWANKGELNKSS